MKNGVTNYLPHYYEDGTEEASLNSWETDESGRRFRRLGKCIEYASEFAFPQDRKDKIKEQAERMKAVEQEKARHTGKDCPFKDGLNTECLTDCALYGNAACVLTMKDPPPDNDTSGKTCPIYRKICSEKCALYFNGCGLINIVKGLNAGKEK